MKKLLLFGAGLITGILLSLAIIFAFGEEKNSDLQIFEKSGECITTNNLEVFQALGDGYALAHELEMKPYGETITSLVVLVHITEGKEFYDEQKIAIPAGKCARQVGIYKYTTKQNIVKTVPIVEIRE